MLQASTDIITNAILADERALFDLTPPPVNVVICRATLGGVDQTGIPTSTYTKVALSTVDFNIGSGFDTTNSRFAPSIAGYYELSAQVAVELPSGTYVGVALRKNGASITAVATSSVAVPPTVHGFAQIYDVMHLNGSTDYVEILGAQFTGARKAFVGQTSFTYFTEKRFG